MEELRRSVAIQQAPVQPTEDNTYDDYNYDDAADDASPRNPTGASVRRPTGDSVQREESAIREDLKPFVLHHCINPYQIVDYQSVSLIIINIGEMHNVKRSESVTTCP